MNPKISNTPFSPRLSGSAKETEQRICNIFQWEKKRLPMVVLVLVVVFLLGICGGLIGFSFSPRNGTISEIYPEYFVEGTVVDIIYEDKADEGPPEPIPGSDEYAASMEYLGNTELRAVWGHRRYIGDIDYRNGAFFLANGQGVPLKIELYPDGYIVVSTGWAGTKYHDDAKVYRAESFDKAAFLALWVPQDDEFDLEPIQSTPAEPDAEEPQSPLKTETEVNVYTLENLTLDGHGASDDSVALTIYRDADGNLTGQHSFSVILGSGKTLTQNFGGEGIYYWFPSLKGAHLTSTEQQSVIVELPVHGSTSGAAQYYILNVVNDTLEVFNLNTFYDDRSLLDGSEVASRPDSELSCVRIPVSAGTKWNSSGWGTLTLDNGQWDFTEDGFFIDTRTLIVDGGTELTLALRGRDDNYGSDGYLYYDQIQIFHSETVLQTITEDSFTPDGHCPFEYFNADASLHAALTEDINFDGNTDFGIPCNTAPNDDHVWFLYDPKAQQYYYAFSLSRTPTINNGIQQLIEERWDDSETIVYNTYEYNEQGKLVLVDSRTDAKD